MSKSITVIAVLVGWVLLQPQTGYARGCGGARGGGGSRGGGYSGSHQGSYSGNHYSGSHEGSYSNGSYSGSRQGSFNGRNYSGSHQDSFSGSRGAGAYNGNREGGSASGAAAFHAGGVGAVGYHDGYGAAGGGYAVGAHAALPTDAGFAAMGGAGAVAGAGVARATEPLNGTFAAARGAAVRGTFNHPGMFGQDWYGAHTGAWQAAGWTAGRPWALATWPAVGAAIGLGAGVQPISYNYGTDITYQGNQVYNGDQPIATADDYYQQSASLVQNAPPADPQSDEWMSLGTFGLVRHEESDPNYVMQLEINKAGVVAGNYCDMLTDNNLPVHGAVDPKTQKLAWSVGGNKKVVGEVGLYNLTQNEAPALIHMGKDKTQQWLLVRLRQPGPTNGLPSPATAESGLVQ